MRYSTLTRELVARRLGLGDFHAAWLTKLDEAIPSERRSEPDVDALSALLARLGVGPENAAEVLRTMPSAKHDPESYWLLERNHSIITACLAARDTVAESLPPLPASLKLFPAHLILVTIDAIRRRHQELGVPDDISWETLSFLGQTMTAYRKSHGEAGIDLSRWDWMRFFGWLFQVGRLTVIPYRLCNDREAGPLFWYDKEMGARLGPGFKKGDPALSIHVPANDPLTLEACQASIRRMQTAFAKVYPDEPMRVATCTTWLLDDQLVEYLPADSNILAFQRLFNLVPGSLDNDEAILHFVFGAERPKEIWALPQRTTLERAVVYHLRQGRHWRLRTGWLDLIKFI